MNLENIKIKNILLADDDVDDCMLFEDALKQLAMPTHLTRSKDGLELMNILEKITEVPPPYIIFLDLNMPRKNGFECLQEIRKKPKLKGIPIVIFSTSLNDDLVEKTYDQGANYYICKPRSFELLVKAIKKALTIDMWYAPQPTKEEFILAFA